MKHLFVDSTQDILGRGLLKNVFYNSKSYSTALIPSTINHPHPRARLELEIFRQLQLSRQQDGLESDGPGIDGPDRDSGQLTASGSLASYDIGEDSALSCTDLNEADTGRPATAYRKDDGQVAFPQPMRNLGLWSECLDFACLDSHELTTMLLSQIHCEYNKIIKINMYN